MIGVHLSPLFLFYTCVISIGFAPHLVMPFMLGVISLRFSSPLWIITIPFLFLFVITLFTGGVMALATGGVSVKVCQYFGHKTSYANPSFGLHIDKNGV